MQYICLKKLRVNGKDYAPGDKIPGDQFDEGRPGKLISYGYIAEAGAEEQTATKPAEQPKKEGTQSSAKGKKNAASDVTE